MESASTTVPSIVVYVTVPNREAGKKLAGSIISEKLAACVNIVPGVESVYWWEGKVQSDADRRVTHQQDKGISSRFLN
ncbi:protein CutA 1, chloroplastic-like [Panicum hallii]|uniref:protein CutA 1, chloroplastic-like n=1 Tax=Panicum hallii TaxID=206008 RepID=UPI000DF4EFF8|nr:protein CutA 1, chloroplastic-like [Panicum hallii]